MFYAAYGDDAQAAAMAAFVRNELKLDRAAVWIEDRDLYPRTIGADFPKSFEALGGTIVLTQSDASAAGFAAFIDKLKAASPPAQAIYVASMPDTAPDLIAAARAAGIDVPLLSGDGWDADTVVAKSKDGVARGHLLHHPQFPRRRHAGDEGLRRRLHGTLRLRRRPTPSRRSATTPSTFWRTRSRRAGSADPAAVRDELAATTNFPGVVGSISYDPGVRVPKKEVSVIEVEDGVKSLRWVAPAGVGECCNRAATYSITIRGGGRPPSRARLTPSHTRVAISR